MRVSVEEISGKKFTVLHRVAGEKEEENEGFLKCQCGNVTEVFGKKSGKWLMTFLPPLPRHPNPEDAPLLYRYMVEEIIPCGTSVNNDEEVEDILAWEGPYQLILNADRGCYEHIITHALLNGNRVEIAIEENETCK